MFMFGYVKINKMDLTFREYEHYRGYYCGLCKYLKDNHGEISRVSLNYDITFLILILTAVYKPKSTIPRVSNTILLVYKDIPITRNILRYKNNVFLAFFLFLSIALNYCAV